MYELEENIIHFVFKAFEGKKRKNENIGLASHSIIVGNMLKNNGANDLTVYVGYLHDIIEDSDYSYDDLKAMYGSQIADDVLKLSEDQSIENYIDRKTEFINRLNNYDNYLIVVEIADKLHNLISDYDLVKTKGTEKLLVEANTVSEVKWFYGELYKLFNRRISNNILLDRFNKVYKEYFE